ncbi:MAG: phosphoenolpyruvate synthase, partial [Gammaproteobacteria bacterium]|nr:phosphoenolpyruvate synthase [Gammaproteobacteria bacterium]
IEKNFVIAQAAAGCGLLEMWEWREIRGRIAPTPDHRQPLASFADQVDASSRAVAWGAAMVRSTYLPVVDLFADFEPRARSFTDDRIRSSILLAFGETAGQLSRLHSRYSTAPHDVFDIEGTIRIRGLNPGLAVGELVVVQGPVEAVEFSPDKIYVLRFSPPDLPPVAGIISVSEGNYVSHVQLLARNLGIPNATIASEDFEGFTAYAGGRVFYAVSAKGRVIIKKASGMTPEEAALIENGPLDAPAKIRVPMDGIDLARTKCLDLKFLRARDSGTVCGPKAANLGELGFFFPDNVASGFVVPFGVFRQHMDQPMLLDGTTYWEFLTETFDEASRRRERSAEDAEHYTHTRLLQLHDAIGNMPLLADFQGDLRQLFTNVFGDSLGSVPVFIRSDTNMEDLEEFTGAGLNLTVPNVVTETAVWRSIREVWASPFTERSYRWRQRYLGNPVHVYPSVLVLRSVDVTKSGVMITAGLEGAGGDGIVVAFNRGAGGAVAGQAAETLLLGDDGIDVLLSPAREAAFTHLPPSGGTAQKWTSFESPVLTRAERAALRRVAAEILVQNPRFGSQGALDIELGFFEGKIWLFQVRPFVENEQARASTYLQEMDPARPEDIQVAMDEKIGGD